MPANIAPKVLVAAAAAATAALSLMPAAASADGFGCTASPVKGTVLGQAVEPARAGSPDSCETLASTVDTLASPLSGSAAWARTGVVGDRAGAAAAVSGLRAGALSSIAGQLAQIALPSGIGNLAVPLPESAQLLGLPAVIYVDATAAANQLVTQRRLPDVALVAADALWIGATAACQTGQKLLDSVANVQGLAALGRSLPTDRTVDTSVPLVDAQTVDFSKLDVEEVVLPAGLSLDDPLTGPIIRAALEDVVADLPTASVPAELGRVVVEPARREQGSDTLRQLGPRVRVEALGRQVADVQLGDALVAAVGAICALAPVDPGAPAPSPAAELALSCASSDVVLTDVVEKDGRVKIVGIAAPRFVGRQVPIILTHTGQMVASAVVGPDGWFRTRARLPRKSIRWSNHARYQAVIDDQESMALKLHRRMRISRMQPRDGKITISGRIYGDLSNKKVVISRRESCTKDVDVVTIKPGSDGRWRVTLPIPAGMEAATYRATTIVRKDGRPFRTFTLPGHVAF